MPEALTIRESAQVFRMTPCHSPARRESGAPAGGCPQASPGWKGSRHCASCQCTHPAKQESRIGGGAARSGGGIGDGQLPAVYVAGRCAAVTTMETGGGDAAVERWAVAHARVSAPHRVLGRWRQPTSPKGCRKCPTYSLGKANSSYRLWQCNFRTAQRVASVNRLPMT